MIKLPSICVLLGVLAVLAVVSDAQLCGTADPSANPLLYTILNTNQVGSLGIFPDGSFITTNLDRRTTTSQSVLEHYNAPSLANPGCILVLPDNSFLSCGHSVIYRFKFGQTNGVFETYSGHGDTVNGLALIPAGVNGGATQFLSASSDKTIKRWIVGALTPAESFLNPSNQFMQSAAALADGTFLSGDWGGNIHHWQSGAASPTNTYNIAPGTMISAIIPLPDLISFAASTSYGSTHNAYRVIVNTGIVTDTFVGHTREIFGMTLMADGSLITASMDATLMRWMPGSPYPLETFTGSGSQINAVAAVTATTFISGGVDSSVRVWKTSSSLSREYLVAHSGNIAYQGIIALDGFTFASVSEDYTVKIWREGQPTTNIQTFTAGITPFAIARGSDGTIVIAEGGTYVRRFALGTSAPVETLSGYFANTYISSLGVLKDNSILVMQANQIQRLVSAGPSVGVRNQWTATTLTQIICSVVLSDDSFLVGGTGGNFVYHFSLRSSTELETYAVNSGVYSLAVLNDGTFITGDSSFVIKRWRVGATAAPIEVYTGHIGIVTALQALADGWFLSGSADMTIMRWQVGSTATSIQTYTGHTGQVTSLIVLADMSFVSGGYDASIRRWVSPFCNGGGVYCFYPTITASVTCSSGTYCPVNSAIPKPLLCPSGHYCGIGTTTPLPCPVGTFFVGTGRATICTDLCSPGSYCPSGSAQDAPCPPGSYCPTPSLIYNCTAGFYCPLRTLQPAICDAGSACPTTWTKVPCPVRHYCPIGTVTPSLCPAGSLCMGSDAKAIQCDRGYYCDDSSSAKPCPPGHFCPIGSSAPSPCPKGTYGSGGINAGDPSTCIPCPLSTITAGQASTNATACLCMPGFYASIPPPGMPPTCTACGVGQVCDNLGTNPVTMRAADLYWKPSLATVVMVPCDSCTWSRLPANNITRCVGGNEGFACGACASGSVHSQSGEKGVCIKCDAGPGGMVIHYVVLVIVSLVFIGYIVYLVRQSLFEAQLSLKVSLGLMAALLVENEGTIMLRLILSHFQVIGFLSGYNLKWSAILNGFFGFTTAVSSASPTSSSEFSNSIDCIFRSMNGAKSLPRPVANVVGSFIIFFGCIVCVGAFWLICMVREHMKKPAGDAVDKVKGTGDVRFVMGGSSLSPKFRSSVGGGSRVGSIVSPSTPVMGKKTKARFTMNQMEALGLGVSCLTIYAGMWTLEDSGRNSTIEWISTVFIICINVIWLLVLVPSYFKAVYTKFVQRRRRGSAAKKATSTDAPPVKTLEMTVSEVTVEGDEKSGIDETSTVTSPLASALSTAVETPSISIVVKPPPSLPLPTSTIVNPIDVAAVPSVSTPATTHDPVVDILEADPSLALTSMDKFIVSMIGIFYVMHPRFVLSGFSLFNCAVFPGETTPRLIGALDVICFQSQHMGYLVTVGLPFFILVIIGLPLAAVLVITSSRKRAADHPDDILAVVRATKFSFLYKGFKEEFYLWEFVILLRKLLLVLIAVFMSRSTAYMQGMTAIFVLVVALVLQLHTNPYVDDVGDSHTM